MIKSDLAEAETIARNLNTQISQIDLSGDVYATSDSDVLVEMERINIYIDIKSKTEEFLNKAIEDANQIQKFGEVFSELDETIGGGYA